MGSSFTTVTRNWQITIPIDIRRQLKIAEGDPIAIDRG
jgi:AbrB family looped-hinge helix DNA binding protein